MPTPQQLGLGKGLLTTNLELQTTSFLWMFGETTILHVKIWNHPIETTIYKWLFGVPPKSLNDALGRLWDGISPTSVTVGRFVILSHSYGKTNYLKNHQPLPFQYLDIFEKYNYHLFGILSKGLNEAIFDNEKLERMATFIFC